MTACSIKIAQATDPESLINSVRLYLNDYGSIKSTDDVQTILRLMEGSTSIINRTIFINIINSTCLYSINVESYRTILKRFINNGGWILFNKWFEDLLNAKQLLLLNQFIEMLKNFPINTELLKQGCIAKSLKKVAKLDYKPLQLSSRKLLFTWKVLVKQETYLDTKSETHENKTPSSVSTKPTNTQPSVSGNSFLQSLSAAMNSNEASRKRRIAPEPHLPKEQVPLESTQTPIIEPPIVPTSTHSTSILDDIESEPKDEGMTPHTPRRVKFKEDSELVDIFYFEMTEQERLEMHGHHDHIDFTEAVHQELLEEKKALQTAKAMVEEKEAIRDWIKPPLIVDVVSLIKVGSCSKESVIQNARESEILAALFIEKSQIPISPTEPDSKEDCVCDKNLAIDIDNIETEIKIPIKPYWENYAFPTPIPTRLFHNSSAQNTDSNIYRRGAYQPYREAQKYINNRPANLIPRDSPTGGYYARPRPFKGYDDFEYNDYEGPRGRNGERIYVPNYDSNTYQPNGLTNYKQPHPDTARQMQYGNTNNGGIVCRHFMRGKCKLGSNCRFRHEAI